jgi:MFS family permease
LVSLTTSTPHPSNEADTPKYDPSVRDAIVSAYYPRATAAADAARSRAQSAYAISSAIAGALVATGLLADLSGVEAWVKILGALALSAWFVASSLYIRAVASPVPPLETAAQPTADAFVEAVLSNARSEREAIDSRQDTANKVSLLAMGLTASTLVFALLAPMPAEEKEAKLVLSPAGAGAITALCQGTPTVVAGNLDVSSLKTDFVVLKSAANVCGRDRVELRLPKKEIVALSMGDDN